MTRFIALIIVLIPIAAAVIGVKLLRDTFFNIIHAPFSHLWTQLISSVLLFILGMVLISGWIFYRERKKKCRYKKKKLK